MKKLIEKNISLIFNIAETIIIIISALIIDINIKDVLMIILVFTSLRINIGSAMHYKSWKSCLVWSTLLLLSIFVLVKIDIYIAICMTLIAGIIVTSKGDINNEDKDINKQQTAYMWLKKDKKSKYAFIEEKIEEYKGKRELEKFENILKESDELSYQIYTKRYYENKSFEKIAEECNLSSNKRITERLDAIQLSMKTAFKLMEEELSLKR
ncbi:MAG: hypothetical protein HFJ40_02345 [Clostridia bacterium]|nr:hypothetical protein [Clostridia bacterium]